MQFSRFVGHETQLHRLIWNSNYFAFWKIFEFTSIMKKERITRLAS